MNFDDDGLLDEPCLSCPKAYVEDIWCSWCCDEKECKYVEEKAAPAAGNMKGGIKCQRKQ